MIATGIQPWKVRKMTVAPEMEQVQKLMPISDEDRRRLKESIEKEGVKDPLRGYWQGGLFHILSGVNRWEIAQEIGLEMINIEVLDIPESEREKFSVDENLSRRHMTNAQKARLVEYFAVLEPGLSDRAMAQKTGMSDKTVKRVREQMKARSEIPNVEKIDSTGRVVGKKPPRQIKKTGPSPLDHFIAMLHDIRKTTAVLSKNERREAAKMLRNLADELEGGL